MVQYGDIADPTGIDDADVSALLNYIKDGTLPSEGSINFILSNITQKESYVGPGFFEVLYLTQNRDTIEYTGPGYELGLASGKGKSIDATDGKFIASFPYAKVQNLFTDDEYAGIAKIYTKSTETNKYEESDLLFPDTITNTNPDTGNAQNTVGNHFHFGENSVAIDGDVAAASALDGTQPYVFLYEDAGTGFTHIHTLSSFSSSSSSAPTVEISGDRLFVGDYTNNTVYVYSITSLKSENETNKPINIETSTDVSSFGQTLVCKDETNLFIGNPTEIVEYTSSSNFKATTGVVYHYKFETNTWNLKNTLLPVFASEPNAIDTAGMYDTSGGMTEYDLDSKFGLYLDVKEKDSSTIYVAVGSPNWYVDSSAETIDNREGGIFVYEVTSDAHSHIKTLSKTSTTTSGIANNELGTGVSFDENFHLYSIYNKDNGSILKYNSSVATGPRDWTTGAELLELQNAGLTGGDLAIDSTDLVYGNAIATKSLRVVYTGDSNDVGTFSKLNLRKLNLSASFQKKNIELKSFSINNVPACCDGFENSISTHGDGDERPNVAGVSVQFFEDGGSLCFHNLNIDGLSNPYGVRIDMGNKVVYGKIKATGKFQNNEVLYISPTQKKYRGQLTSNSGFENILSFEGNCTVEPTPTPTPTQEHIIDDATPPCEEVTYEVDQTQLVALGSSSSMDGTRFIVSNFSVVGTATIHEIINNTPTQKLKISGANSSSYNNGANTCDMGWHLYGSCFYE